MDSRLIDLVRADCEEALLSSADRLAELKNRKVLVTGGTGFIGTWLAETITHLNDRHRFNTAVVLLSRGADDHAARMPHLAARRDVQLMAMDIRNLSELPDDVAYVVHAAATPDNRQHVSDPLGVMSTITRGTGSLLESLLKLTGLRKVVNISSGQVYGKPDPQMESVPETFAGGVDCTSITSIYPEAKRYAESLCCAYWSLYKVPAVTARPFAFIGPYQSLDKPWAINNFIRDALNNTTIRIIGNGLPMRSYMYPSDMAVWVLRMLVDGTPGVAYNLGSQHGISLRDLAEKIKKLAGTESRIDIRNFNEDRSKFIPDIGLCKRALGLQVTVDIDQALERSIRWYRGIRESA